MAVTAAGFEGADFARARAAQAAGSPAIWSVFPVRIERRATIFRCGDEFEEFISAADCPARPSVSRCCSRRCGDEDANEICGRVAAGEHPRPSGAWTGP